MGYRSNQRQYGRTGNTAKCPACGVPMDPEAYRCPKCRIYFCFKCRRRVQPRDPQYQCMNQQCGYYGKLLCNACIVEVPQMEERPKNVLVEPERQELIEAAKARYFAPLISAKAACWVFALLCILLFSALLYFGVAAEKAAIATPFLAAVIALWLATRGENIPAVPALYRTIPAVYKSVVEPVEVGRSKCCIACRQAAEDLQ